MQNYISDTLAFRDDVFEVLSSDSPCFVSRIGGSDTDAVIDYAHHIKRSPGELGQNVDKYRPIVEKFNGYYDFSNSVDKYFKYCECILDCYRHTNIATIGGNKLLSVCFPDAINPRFHMPDFVNKVATIEFMNNIIELNPGSRYYPYNRIENCISHPHSLFRLFETLLPGKRVLVVSPFAESIQANFGNKMNFFQDNYRYPEFILENVNTPITYSGLPRSLYPDENWFETLDRITRAVGTIEFDIALLACGSYAMPIGRYIEVELKRKAIYVGGVLQLYFGIMGRRYQDVYFTRQLNVEAMIYPVERDRYLKHFPIGNEALREAFGAYF